MAYAVCLSLSLPSHPLCLVLTHEQAAVTLRQIQAMLVAMTGAGDSGLDLASDPLFKKQQIVLRNRARGRRATAGRDPQRNTAAETVHTKQLGALARVRRTGGLARLRGCLRCCGCLRCW